MIGAQMGRVVSGDQTMRALMFTLCLTLAAASAQAAPPAKPTTPTAAARPTAPKPSATKPDAPKPAKPKPGPFYATNPADIIALFSSMGAKATQTRSEDGMVFLDVTAPGAAFGVQMIGCDAKGRTCRAMALFSVFDKPGVTLAQINDFNRSQFACRGVLTPTASPASCTPPWWTPA